MLLVVDLGNTKTVVGMYPSAEEDGPLLDHWRLATSDDRTSDEHALLFDQLLGLHDLRLDDVTGICISSTAPGLTPVLREMCERRLRSAHTVVIEPGVKTGMPVRYDNPSEVGPDRIANAVAAHDLYGGPTIVVDFSTAIIFDGISAKGEYLGGAIFPGIEISLDALFGRAAALRRVELAAPRTPIGRSIAASIQSGVVHGYGAVVDGMCRRFEEVMGPSTIVVTGQLSELVAPFSGRDVVHEPWLTPHGLRLIYRRNQP